MTLEQDMERVVAALREASLFKDLEDFDLQSIARIAVEVEPAPNTVLMTLGEQGGYLWVLVDGLLEFEVFTIQARAELGRPEILWEFRRSFLHTVTPRPCVLDRIAVFCGCGPTI